MTMHWTQRALEHPARKALQLPRTTTQRHSFWDSSTLPKSRWSTPSSRSSSLLCAEKTSPVIKTAGQSLREGDEIAGRVLAMYRHHWKEQEELQAGLQPSQTNGIKVRGLDLLSTVFRLLF